MLVSNGVVCRFELLNETATTVTYVSAKHLIFNELELEGAFPEAFVIRTELNADVEMLIEP